MMLPSVLCIVGVLAMLLYGLILAWLIGWGLRQVGGDICTRFADQHGQEVLSWRAVVLVSAVAVAFSYLHAAVHTWRIAFSGHVLVVAVLRMLIVPLVVLAYEVILRRARVLGYARFLSSIVGLEIAREFLPF